MLPQLASDVALVIWSYLGTKDLVNLHTTLNKGVQRLLYRRGLSIDLSTFSEAKGAKRYFVRSVRELSALRLTIDGPFSEEEETLLSTLNPAKLLLHFTKRTQEAKENPSTAELSDVTHPAMGNCLPKFATHNPRLQSLRLASSLRDFLPVDIAPAFNEPFPPESLQAILLLPPTLTHFQAYILSADFAALIASLPESLQVLNLSISTSNTPLRLSAPFSRFSSLSQLTLLGGAFDETEEIPTVPATLTSLQIPQMQYFPLKQLMSAPWRDSALTTFSMGSALEMSNKQTQLPTKLDLARVMPSSLETLSLRINRSLSRTSYHGLISTLPVGLTSLEWSSVSFEAAYLDMIAPLCHLATLTIDNHMHGGFERSQHDDMQEWTSATIAKLPRSLTTLNMIGAAAISLPSALFKELPQNLTSLTVNRCPMDEALELRKALPKATLTLNYSIELWGPTVGAKLLEEFPELVEPVFDICLFRSTVKRRYLDRGVSFLLDIDVDPDQSAGERFLNTTSVILKPVEEDDDTTMLSLFSDPFPTMPHLNAKFPAITKLVIHLDYTQVRGSNLLPLTFPPLLTHIELSKVNFSGTSFPGLAELTYLSSDSKLELTTYPALSDFPLLTHLDAPLWQFTVPKSQLNSREKFSVLRFTERDPSPPLESK